MSGVEEWNRLSWELEQHHALFYQLWGMGKPVFDGSVPTAAIKFDPEGRYLQFVFNPDYWERLTFPEKAFVISHECLHVILQHGIRSKNATDPKRVNVALDLVVNHTLVRGFGFSRSQLSMDQDLCWVDTIFPDQPAIPTNQSFEYYYPLIKESRSSLDSHDFLDGDFSSVLEKLGQALSSEEKEQLDQKVGQLAGTQGLGSWAVINPQPVKKKKKWEEIIRKWSKQFLREDEKEIEQWVRPHRRYHLLDSSLMLPTEDEVEVPDRTKIKIWLFQDASGSCWNLKERFFRAAESIPTSRFKLRLHTFDTRVHPTDLKSRKIVGGGGTSFTALEKYIQETIKEESIPYPDVVFVLTDGYGNYIKPEFPTRWHWFLSRGISGHTFCLPATSFKYDLRDFE